MATQTPSGQVTISDRTVDRSPDIPWLSIIATSLFVLLLAATLIVRWHKNRV